MPSLFGTTASPVNESIAELCRHRKHHYGCRERTALAGVVIPECMAGAVVNARLTLAGVPRSACMLVTASIPVSGLMPAAALGCGFVAFG